MRTFSGIQPTGAVHLGNYLGAIQSWSKTVQASTPDHRLDNFFCIVDLHAITIHQNPSELKSNIMEMAASLLACGLDPKRCVLFQQSSVPEHTQLCWLLTCLSTVQGMAGMSTYKDKSANMKEIPLGLYMYPLLQAADILLYKGTHVPVGEDNLQNVELSRKVARLFNNRFSRQKPTFPVPKAVLVEASARVKSLRQPTKKMSKSDTDSKSCIYLNDSPDDILAKLKKAMTDSTSEITYDPETRPGVSNLVAIHSAVTGQSPEEIVGQSTSLDTGQYKLKLADILIEHLKPIREQFDYYLDHKDHLKSVIQAGDDTAKEIAEQTWIEAKSAVGFI